eukprot:CCRYP_003748-RA/>CCRYP_003748-RA protein AED:0.29 eAED:0.66 QI:0/0/0/1/0/0/3/0/222
MLIPMPTFPPILSFLLLLHSPVSVTSFLPPPTTSPQNSTARNSPPSHRPSPPCSQTPSTPIGNSSSSPRPLRHRQGRHGLFHRCPLLCYEPFRVTALTTRLTINPSLYVDAGFMKRRVRGTGKIYQSVIERERVLGEYLGKTVQVVPNVSDAIQEWVLRVAEFLPGIVMVEKSRTEERSVREYASYNCAGQLVTWRICLLWMRYVNNKRMWDIRICVSCTSC